MLVAYDASEHRWGSVKDAWGQMSCEEKLSAASMARELGRDGLKYFNFRINIQQNTASRDWHFALLTCGNTEAAKLSLTLEATKGTLSMFEANTHFDFSSCPQVDVPWLEAAHDEVGFWLLLVGTLVAGCSLAFGVVACRHLRKKADFKQFQHTAAASGTEPVIGRPCNEIGEAKVVEGQIRANATPEGSRVSAPDCV